MVFDFLITFGAIVYQTITDSIHDKKLICIDNEEYNFKLTRSHGREQDCKVELIIPKQNISGILEFKKFPS